MTHGKRHPLFRSRGVAVCGRPRGLALLLLLVGNLSAVAMGEQQMSEAAILLAPGRAVTRELRGGEAHAYRLELAAGCYARLVVWQQGVDVTVHVGANGRAPAAIDRPSGARGPESVSLLAETPTAFRITITAWDKAAPAGRYEIRLDAPRPLQPADADRALAERLVSEGESLRAAGTSGALGKAAEKFTQSLALWRRLGERYEQAVALYGLGWSYQPLGEQQRAITAFRESVTLMWEAGDDYGTAQAQTGLAWAYLHTGEFAQAEALFKEAIRVHRACGNPRGEASALYGLGWIGLFSEQPEAARGHLQRALELRWSLGERRGAALVLAALGRVYGRLERNEDALDCLTRAVAQLR